MKAGFSACGRCEIEKKVSGVGFQVSGIEFASLSLSNCRKKLLLGIVQGRFNIHIF
jgi:hypothetical protein